jgi:hypothetical protein
MTSDFDYKKYSLEKLQEWVHDAMSSDASPHEIYSAIREAVREDYYYHKDCTSRASGLLELLSGHRPVADTNVSEYKGSTVSSVETKKDLKEVDPQEYFNEQAYNEVGSNESPFGKQWTYNGKPATYDEIVADGWEMTADGFWFRGVEKDKVRKWILPVEETTNAETGLEEYFVTFPNDLLYMTNLKEGDQIEWVDQGDGSYLLRKVKND